MADGFLEKHYDDYEARKAAWLRTQRRQLRTAWHREIEHPEDEAL